MEKYNMKEVWRVKLLELKLQKKLMAMDKQFTEEDLNNMDEMIKQVEKEYAKTLVEEKKQKSEKIH